MQKQACSFAPLGQKPARTWQWRYLLLPIYVLLLVIFLVATLIGAAFSVLISKIFPGLIAKQKLRPLVAKSAAKAKDAQSPSIVWKKVAPMALSAVLILTAGMQLWYLQQDSSSPEPSVEIIVETINPELPSNFTACKFYSCSTLPYEKLTSYQGEWLALAKRTRSARLYLNIALSYFYQDNNNKYQEYLQLAQAMDPGTSFTLALPE